MDSNQTNNSSFQWQKWLFIAAVAAPLGIVLHELGHFIAAKLLGFPEVVLHYASVSDASVEGTVPSWQQGIQAVAGPLVTLSIVIGCWLAAHRTEAKSLYIAPPFAVGVRTVGLGFTYLISRSFFGMKPTDGNFDELNFALNFGLNPDIIVGLNLLLILLIWSYLVWLMPSNQRWKKLGLIGLGSICGIATYMFIGPFILP